MLAIFKREIKSYFYSPMAYVLIGIFMALASVNFKWVLYTGILDFTSFFLSTRIVLLFVLPLLTMRILSV